MKDGVIDPKGGMLVSGPKGSIQLDKDDSIIAGTNLGGGGGGRSSAAMIERMDKLIAVTERGSTITMDGNLVGRSVRLAGEEVKIRKGVNKSMGLTGILAKGLNKTLGIDLSDSLQGARDKAEDLLLKIFNLMPKV